jgi:hypothetical protein
VKITFDFQALFKKIKVYFNNLTLFESGKVVDAVFGDQSQWVCWLTSVQSN